MFEAFLATVISFFITYITIPTIIRIADKRKLYDLPDERKLHDRAIAPLGGVGIFLGFFLAILLTVTVRRYQEFRFLYAAVFIVFFVGLADDLISLSAVKKLLAQIIAAALIIHFGGIRIDSLGGFLDIHSLHSFVSIPLTYIFIIFIVNAFNLINGIDGLAGSLGLLVSSLLAAYFYFSGQAAYAILAISLATSLLAFLLFNYNPAKILMGDSGSLLIGLILSVLAVKFMNICGAPGAAIPLDAGIAISLALLIVPIADTAGIFAIRLFKGHPPFSPDRNHIHHLLLDSGLGHAAVTLCCIMGTAVLVCAIYFLRSFGNNILIPALLVICLGVSGYIHFILSKRKKAGDYVPKQSKDRPVMKIVAKNSRG